MIAELKVLAANEPDDSPVWREIRYLTKHSERGRLRYDVSGAVAVPMGSGAIESTIRRVINLRLKGNGIYWTEDNAEAVFQLRAAVVSGRWEEIVEHTREAMAKDRRTDWRWTPPDCLAELKALEDEDDDSTQPSTSPPAAIRHARAEPFVTDASVFPASERRQVRTRSCERVRRLLPAGDGDRRGEALDRLRRAQPRRHRQPSHERGRGRRLCRRRPRRRQLGHRRTGGRRPGQLLSAGPRGGLYSLLHSALTIACSEEGRI